MFRKPKGPSEYYYDVPLVRLGYEAKYYEYRNAAGEDAKRVFARAEFPLCSNIRVKAYTAQEAASEAQRKKQGWVVIARDIKRLPR